MSTRTKFGCSLLEVLRQSLLATSNATMPAKLNGISIRLSLQAANSARTKSSRRSVRAAWAVRVSARFSERWERGRHENVRAGRNVCQFGHYAARACGGPLIPLEQIAGVRNCRPEQIQIFRPKAMMLSLLKRPQACEQLLLPSRNRLQVRLFLWIDRPKDHCEQGFDFLLVCRLCRPARTHNRFGFDSLGQRCRALGFDDGPRRRRRRRGLGRLRDSSATLSGLTFPGSGAGSSTLMAAGGGGEEDADGGLGNLPALAASIASLHHVFAQFRRDPFSALRRDRGFCPNSSINSFAVCGATTGATLSGLTVPGSAGRSAMLAAGGAEKEDAGWALDNSPAWAASGFGGATTGSLLFGTGFSVTGSGAAGGGAAAGLAVCRRERTLVLDPPGFAGPGWAGCAAGKRYVFVVPRPPVTSNPKSGGWGRRRLRQSAEKLQVSTAPQIHHSGDNYRRSNCLRAQQMPGLGWLQPPDLG
jgi:hypothetical protein